MSASPTALTNRPTMAGRTLCRWLMAVFLGVAPWLHAQTDGPAPDFEKTSLTLRTALHFDPAAEGPLQKLVKLYVESGKRSALTGLYKSHLAQYPDDESATIVLARLYMELSDDQAGTFLQTAVAKHAQNALLAWVHHRFLTSRFDPLALEELDRAIALEVNATRRSAWLTDLMKQAATQNRRVLVRGRFEALLNAQMLTLDQRLKWARVALGNQLSDVATLLVKGADVSSLQGDASVEAVLVLAETEAAGGQKIEAAKRLDELLGKLAADYWRRREVLLLRLQVAGDAADRDRLIAEARKKWETAPSNEAEALSLADLLTAVQQKTEAATVLEKAANLSPQSRLLETRLLDLLSTTNQEARAIQFLDQRLLADPKREDLALQRVRLQLASGRSADAMEKLKALVVGRTPIQQATLHLDLARWLRTRNLLTEAATVLEQLLAGDSSRWDARKELGEIYGVLKRTDELEKLFNIPIPDDVPPEVRMEVVQFLMAQKQWSQARAALEKWIASRPAELEGRLLLARIQAITGASADSDALLLESRKLCDTDARYAAWLNAAFELASEAGGESAFLDAERQRLWPLKGETWDTPRIQRLLALADLAGNAQLDGEAEKIVRAAMSETTLNAETRDDLQLRLLDVIQRQTGREKEAETQLLALSKTSGAKQDDLRLRLAMLYHGAGRADLFTQLLEQVDIDRCSEAEVLVRASNASKEIGLNEPSAKMIERAVKLQPDQPQPWVQWVSRLADIGDEPSIRQALQQMLGMAKTWNLHEETRDLLRRHLAASCWREAGRLICQEPIPPTAIQRALLVLDEAERLEITPQRRLWCVWTRGWLGQLANNAAEIAEAKRVLGAEKKETDLMFPDGLSLSLEHALALLTSPQKTTEPPSHDAPPPLAPLALGWGHEVEKGARIQRFNLTPDGRHVVLVTDRAVLSVLDRKSGKLRWTTAGIASRRPPAPPMIVGSSHERVMYPLEFISSSDAVFALRDGCIECRDIENGNLRWTVDHLSKTDQLALEGEHVLLWQPSSGKLDAYAAKGGKLAWSRQIPLLAKTPATSSTTSQVWISSGISTNEGQVMVYGNGTAVVRGNDGALLWLARGGEAPSFPLELRTTDQEASPLPEVFNYEPWTTQAAGGSSMGSGFSIVSGSGVRFSNAASAPARRIFSSPMAALLPGFPGMYGGVSGSPHLNWGSDGARLLRGRTIWTFQQGAQPQRASVSGLPLGPRVVDHNNIAGVVLGFASGIPVLATTDGVRIFRPEQRPSFLWQSATDIQGVRPASARLHPFQAATLAGRALLVATADELFGRDCITGEMLFKTTPPASLIEWGKESWAPMQEYQSVRWTAKGTMLYDGQGASLVVDWRSAAAEGDWIIPVGLDKLACLRELQSKATVSAETTTR